MDLLSDYLLINLRPKNPRLKINKAKPNKFKLGIISNTPPNTDADPELLPATESTSFAEIEATFRIEPSIVTRTTISHATAVPAAIFPIFQVTVEPATEAPQVLET